MLKDYWNWLLEEVEKRKWIVYSILIGFAILVLVLGIILQEIANALVAFGTIGMVLAIVYIEIIKPWLQKPEIKIQFKNETPFCLDVIPSLSGNKYHNYHIRIKVINKGKAIAKKVRGKLIMVKDKQGNLLERFDPVFIHWSSMEIQQKVAPYINEKQELKLKKYYEQPNYLDPIDLSSGEYDHLEIVYTSNKKEKKNEVKICTSSIRRGTAKEFRMNQTQNIYFLTIVISGENIEPATEEYKLVWDGKKYDEIKMCEVGRKRELG